MAKALRQDNVTIASSGTTSTSLGLESSRILLGIITPAALTGTSFTFKASFDGSTFNPVYDEGTLYSVNVGTSRHVSLKRQVFDSCKYVQVVSGSSEGALRTLIMVSGE